MRKQKAFALLDVLLAVALLAVAVAGSYSLVKSFRATSSIQQLTRYSTTIAQNISPFLEGGSMDVILSGDALSKGYFTSTGIPAEDLDCNEDNYCYVKTGMYAGGSEVVMNFASDSSETDPNVLGANFFLMSFSATGSQANQISQNLGGMFAVYCNVSSATANINSGSTTECGLQDQANKGEIMSVYLVFPKSGSAPPANASITPQA